MTERGATIRQLLRRVHGEEDGNLLVMSAILIMLLVFSLAVTVNLAEVVHNKIKAQNAADAAAMTGAIWQVRGCHFVQDLNNLVYYSDTAAFACLGIAAACSLSTAAPIAGQIANLVGNVSLGLCIACHATSQFVLMPFRDAAQFLFPLVCYLAASEMAARNAATPVLGAVRFTDRLLRELAQRLGEGPPGGNLLGRLEDLAGTNAAGTTVFRALEAVPVHAFGLEARFSEGLGGLLSLGGVRDDVGKLDPTKGGGGRDTEWRLPDLRTVSLHLKKTDWSDKASEAATAPAKWTGFQQKGADTFEQSGAGDAVGHLADTMLTVPPLKIADVHLDALLTFCAALPMCHVAQRYFDIVKHMPVLDLQLGSNGKPKFTKDLGSKWNHGWYESERDDETQLTALCVTTWIAMVQEGDEKYDERTSIWRAMGGLGVPVDAPESVELYNPDTEEYEKRDVPPFGELGCMALASSQAFVDPVAMFRPTGARGWVQLVPVKVFEDKPDMLDYGICH